MNRFSTVLLTIVFLSLGTGSAVAQAAGGNPPIRSTEDGVYTEAQAISGAETFEKACSQCHMPQDFTRAFLQAWSGATVGALFEVISTMMPEDRPGGLRPREYAAVLAYIFQVNGVPAGENRLASQKTILDTILIQWRP